MRGLQKLCWTTRSLQVKKVENHCHWGIVERWQKVMWRSGWNGIEECCEPDSNLCWLFDHHSATCCAHRYKNAFYMVVLQCFQLCHSRLNIAQGWANIALCIISWVACEIPLWQAPLCVAVWPHQGCLYVWQRTCSSPVKASLQLRGLQRDPPYVASLLYQKPLQFPPKPQGKKPEN